MKSSREQESQPLPLTVDEIERRRARHIAGIVLVLLICAALAAGTWYWRLPGVDQQLEQVREVLQSSSIDDSQQRIVVQELQRQIDAIQPNTPEQKATHALFKATVLAIDEAGYGKDAPVGFSKRVDKSFFEIDAAHCRVADRLLAAKVVYRSKRQQQADWLVETILKEPPANDDELAEALRLRVQLTMDGGRGQEMLIAARQLADIRPQDPFPWQAMARLYESQGQAEPLIAALYKLVPLDSENEAENRLKLAAKLLEIGNAAGAEEQLAWLQTHAPERIQQQSVLLAKLALLKGDISSATERVDKILQENPHDEQAVLIKARLLLADQKPSDAAQLLDKYVAFDPYSAEVRYQLGQAYARLGKQDLAKVQLDSHRRILDAYVRLNQLLPRAAYERTNHRLRREIAQLYLDVGDRQAANEWMESAVRLREAEALAQ